MQNCTTLTETLIVNVEQDIAKIKQILISELIPNYSAVCYVIKTAPVGFLC